MNFNLSSPTENGHQYIINFKEQVVIPPGSKVKLNFAELTRSSNVVFNEDQFVTIDNNLVFPTVYPTERTKSNDPFKPDKDTAGTNKFTITKGTYSFINLLSAIFTGIRTLISPSRQTQYIGTFQEGLRGIADNDFIFGLRLSSGDSEITSPFENFLDFHMALSGTDKHLATTDNDFETGFTYKKAGGVNGTYDSYGFTNDHIYHLCPRPLNDVNGDQAPIQNLIKFQSLNNYGSNPNDLFVGINGKEYSNGLINAFTRTSGNNPPVLKDGVPTAFFGVEFSDTNLRVTWGRTTGGRSGIISKWTTQDNEITNMRFTTLSPFDIVPTDVGGSPLAAPLTGYIQLYQDPLDVAQDTFRLYCRVLGLKGGLTEGRVITDFNILYDSKDHDRFFPYEFFVSADLTTGASATANTVNSQIPFVMGCYAKNNGEGVNVFGATFNKSSNGADDTKPNTMVHNYRFGFSDEIAKVFDTTQSRLLSGNVGEDSIDYQFIRDLQLNWKTANYGILLENLPIGNRKNTTEKREGSKKMPILANIPSPFGTNQDRVNVFGDDQQIISVYEPYNTIESDLLNIDEISTNNMRVKVINMNDNTLANDITKSVINFTIHQN
tara:strand:+ start:827 stop:2647 length:1821 start_codon:yes stop_codon:yes gene_type:complete